MNEKIATSQKEKELLGMNLRELYKQADYKDKNGMLFNADCMDVMAKMEDESVDLIVTDPRTKLPQEEMLGIVVVCCKRN